MGGKTSAVESAERRKKIETTGSLYHFETSYKHIHCWHYKKKIVWISASFVWGAKCRKNWPKKIRLGGRKRNFQRKLIFSKPHFVHRYFVKINFCPLLLNATMMCHSRNAPTHSKKTRYGIKWDILSRILHPHPAPRKLKLWWGNETMSTLLPLLYDSGYDKIPMFTMGPLRIFIFARIFRAEDGGHWVSFPRQKKHSIAYRRWNEWKITKKIFQSKSGQKWTCPTSQMQELSGLDGIEGWAPRSHPWFGGMAGFPEWIASKPVWCRYKPRFFSGRPSRKKHRGNKNVWGKTD